MWTMWYWWTRARQNSCCLPGEPEQIAIYPRKHQPWEGWQDNLRETMAMKNAGMTICALLILVSASWGTDTPPKKFRTSSPHPHHSLAQTEAAGRARSSGSSVSKSQSAHEKEVERLEHQNSSHLQAQSRQRSAKAGQPSHVHPEPAGRSSGINFGYHPPRAQSTGASGARKH